nr:uncharacterized protein LOC129472949 isoform X3 [Symphalangus syndactylus]
MVTGERDATPPLWPVEARLAALLPDLLVFRKSRGLEPELATAQGVLLGVHVTDSFQFQTKPSRTQEAFSSECCRTEEEFLDQVKRKLAQTSPEKDLLTTKPCHCKDILKLVLSPLTQHCLVIGETTCAFYYLLEAAAASLDLSDNYMRPSFI